MQHYLFLDETGDHGLNFVDKHFPLFVLCGCVIESNALETINKQVAAFKIKYFGTTEVTLHSREIRKCEGAFQILFDLKLKQQFYADLNLILSNSEYHLLASAIRKEEHIKKYGRGAKDTYSIALSFVIERLVFYLDTVGEDADTRIVVEQRGKKEDQILLSHFNSIMNRGTYYLSPDRLSRRIKKLSFHHKHENITGLEIADLCAYPLARHLLRPREPYIPFGIIENKIYHDKKGKYMGWGLKVFP